MKRDTIKRGPLYSNAALTERWAECWGDMLQERIQAWIERIVRQVQEVVDLERGKINWEMKGESSLANRKACSL